MDEKQIEKVNCLIIGSGPAGYTAAIYAARADLKPILYTGLFIGGQLTKTGEVENYPGYPDSTMGPEMMANFHRQAAKMGADLRIGYANAVDFSKRPFRVSIDDKKELLADTVIIATGATPKWLGLEAEQTYAGKGVSACATCDGFFFKGQDVAIVGGGDTAAEEALHLAKLCKKVYMLVRKTGFRASKTMVHKIENTENIEVIFNVEVKNIVGDGRKVNGVCLRNNQTNTDLTLSVSGFFVAIGHHPNTELFKSWLDMDKAGYIQTKNCSTATNIPGIFCCGDAQDANYRQAITAAGSGCMAAIDCERFLLAMEHSPIAIADVS
ncbi:thioredoxin-disulfide reductase [Arachidicoccus terrestris]|uniref:thioredoxin-disulfide reductase n=1 Tax=Arachidicoccus terrestris TaxID=2875539 RepID=UPI001CC79778|nr:thioredoxin-disulfide reductase [Arachidicoccus terrestris]UAY56013.1 thioredoxin-disulfide reductase [Arachidicoccus terrestris]